VSEPTFEPAVCVVLHDVAGSTLAGCERVIEAVAAVAPLPQTLLAVPRHHGQAPTPAFEQWLGARQAGGDELALHGWTHLDEGVPHGPLDRLRRRVYTRGEGEFWALDRAEATARLAAGRAWFAQHGWPLHGFVAPAWLLGAAARAAVREQGFEYTSTLRHIELLPGGERITSQSLVYSTSSAWRRQASIAWARAVAASQASNPVLRLELHPRDADATDVRRSWQRALEAALQRRRACTVVALTRRWRAAHGARPPAALRAG
jgi:predicted deacetylase